MFFQIFPCQRNYYHRNYFLQPSQRPGLGDVTIDNASSPQILQIYLKRSKTDQAGKGAHIYIGKTGGKLCSVSATLTYMASRGPKPGPFLKFKDGKSLTKAKFSSSIREALQRIGLPYMNFTGHSFRIGAATAAAKVGLEDSTIWTLGGGIVLPL